MSASEIHDLGTSRYEGPRTPPGRRFWTVSRNVFGVSWRSRWGVKFPFLVAVATTIAAAVVMYVLRDAGRSSPRRPPAATGHPAAARRADHLLLRILLSIQRVPARDRGRVRVDRERSPPRIVPVLLRAADPQARLRRRQAARARARHRRAALRRADDPRHRAAHLRRRLGAGDLPVAGPAARAGPRRRRDRGVRAARGRPRRARPEEAARAGALRDLLPVHLQRRAADQRAAPDPGGALDLDVRRHRRHRAGAVRRAGRSLRPAGLAAAVTAVVTLCAGGFALIVSRVRRAEVAGLGQS